jgi:hydroxymethylpyrimidine/phosphomethylpyrimidine kinase
MPIVMTIAGSDSGAGAGIQADLKTVSALGGYCVTVITAITSQNTCGVNGIHPIPLEMIENQFDTLIKDFNISSVKTGMLQDVNVINLVAKCISKSKINNYVLDPVMIATSGDKLIFEDTIQAIINKLFPLSKVATPNLDEAELLLNKKINSLNELQNAAVELLSFGSEAVLLKGGHLEIDAQVYDVLVTKNNPKPNVLATPRINTKNLHGSGCTLSSAIATYLANGYDINSSIINAKNYIHNAILAGSKLKLGKGNGPLNHFFEHSENISNHSKKLFNENINSDK